MIPHSLVLVAPQTYTSDDRTNRRGYPEKAVSPASIRRLLINTVNRPNKARKKNGQARFRTSNNASRRIPGLGEPAIRSPGSRIPVFLRLGFKIITFPVHTQRRLLVDQVAMGDGGDGFEFAPAALNDILTLINFKGPNVTLEIDLGFSENSLNQRE